MNPVRGYHAHVYLDAATRQQAVQLGHELDRRFPVSIGRIHDRPIGPHPKPMFQVLVAPADFERVISWLMQNRQGLDVLVHPDTGDDLADHRDSALWLGNVLSLDLSALETTAARWSRR